MFGDIACKIVSFPFNATCWVAQNAWAATPEAVKEPARTIGKTAKMALYVSACCLIYQAYKNSISDSSAESPEESSGILNYVEPVVTMTSPVVAAGAGYAWNMLRDAVVDTANDAFTEIIPSVSSGALPLSMRAASSLASLTVDGVQGMWGFFSNLEHTTKACLAASLFAKYYAAPRIRKLYTGAPLPSWVSRNEAQRVTPLSRGLEKLKKCIWKSNEVEPVLNEDIRNRVETIIEANKNILKNRGYFKNILLLGDPGTGKTMLVEKIARDSGFNYIKISGAEFAWYVKSGTALSHFNELLAFSRESAYPTILVIDEIDALCPNSYACKDGKPTRAEKEFRSAFLAATGSKSNKLLIVGTTNFEGDMDQALLSRFNSRIQMKLPDYASRVMILTQYIDKYLGKIPERDTCLNKESIEKLAERTEGMSGRTLYQFVDSLVMQRPASDEGQLTKESIEEVLGFYLEDLERDRQAEEKSGRIRVPKRGLFQDSKQNRTSPLIVEPPQISEEPKAAQESSDVKELPQISEKPIVAQGSSEAKEPPQISEKPIVAQGSSEAKEPPRIAKEPLKKESSMWDFFQVVEDHPLKAE